MTIETLNSDIARLLDRKATEVEIKVALQTGLGYLPKVTIEYTLSKGQRRIGRTRQGNNVLTVRIQLPKPAKPNVQVAPASPAVPTKPAQPAKPTKAASLPTKPATPTQSSLW